MARNIKKTIILLVTMMFIVTNCIDTSAKNLSIKTKCGKYYKNNEVIAKVLEDADFDDVHIAGVIGNWAVESTLNPSQLEIGGGHQGHGLMQVSNTAGTYWTVMLRDWHKINSCAEVQTKWLMKYYAPERWKEYKKKKFSSPEEAAAYFCKRLEGVSSNSERQVYANQWYKERIKKKEQEAKEAEERQKELLRLKSIDEILSNQKVIEVVQKNSNESQPTPIEIGNETYDIFFNQCDFDEEDIFELFIFSTLKNNGITILVQEREKEFK